MRISGDAPTLKILGGTCPRPPLPPDTVRGNFIKVDRSLTVEGVFGLKLSSRHFKLVFIGTMKVGVRDSSGRFLRSFDVSVKLPWDSVITLIVQHCMTVADLQSLIEVSSGIPCQLVDLSFQSNHRLDEHLTLQELHVIQGLQFKVSLPKSYESLIFSTVKGCTTTAMNEINGFKNNPRFAKGVALFISAHKGYHYFVEKLLSSNADPDFRTRSLRTPLHAACAMGNNACVENLLRFGASHTLKDINGQTSLDVAFSCGHREVQQRIQMIQNSKSRQKRFAGLNSSWSKTPRFPVSNLARSVSPVIALRELAIQPGPVLTVTSYQDTKSGRSCLQLIGNEGESDDHTTNALESDENLKHHGRFISKGNSPVSSSKRHGRPKTAPPRTSKCVVLGSDDIASSQSSSVVTTYQTQDRNQIAESDASVSIEHKASSATIQEQTKRSPYFTYSTNPSSVVKTPDRLWMIDSSRRKQLITPKRQDGMLRPSTAPLTKGHSPENLEANKRAFQEWLQMKSQGVKDDKMIKRVSEMVEKAFGRSNDEPSHEENNTSKSSRKGISFEEWRKRKDQEVRIKPSCRANDQTNVTEGNQRFANKQERLKHCSVSQWFEEKRKEEMKQKSRICKKKKFNRVHQERRTQQAEAAFHKWRLQKEWEELARLI